MAPSIASRRRRPPSTEGRPKLRVLLPSHLEQPNVHLKAGHLAVFNIFDIYQFAASRAGPGSRAREPLLRVSEGTKSTELLI